jgi:hypothetical protein
MLRAAPSRAPAAAARPPAARGRRARRACAASAAPAPPPPPASAGAGAASRRAALLSLTAAAGAAAGALPAPRAAAASPAVSAAAAAAAAQPFTARCGASLRLPPGWVTASDRDNAGRGALTLNLWGDFDAVDTVSLRREPLPEGGAATLGGALDAAAAAAALTAPERAAVVAGAATGTVAGVPNGSSGTLSYDVLSSARRDAAAPGAPPYYEVETRSEQCRGNVQEGAGGALVRRARPGGRMRALTLHADAARRALRLQSCYGPRGDELPTITRHALSVYVARPPFMCAARRGGAAACAGRRPRVALPPRPHAASFRQRRGAHDHRLRPVRRYVLRASCAEARWAAVGPLLRSVAASFDADGLRNPPQP